MVSLACYKAGVANELIDLRGRLWKATCKELADSLNADLAPIIAGMKAAGMTDAEINLALNRAMFDEFAGLHGFPPEQRP